VGEAVVGASGAPTDRATAEWVVAE
jgi:hypothetical protein